MMRSVFAKLVLLMIIGSPLGAQEPKQSGPKIPRASVVQQPSGGPALAIQYPWGLHQQASIEVRWVPAGSVDEKQLRPVFFVGDYLKGLATIKVYQARDRAADSPSKDSYIRNSQDKVEFDILGQRNTLGKPAVTVIPRFKPDDKAKEPPPDTAAVFYFLDSWSVDKQHLWLDLPREYFAKAGDLHVWFLRGDKIVWQEKVSWPGYPVVAVKPKAGMPKGEGRRANGEGGKAKGKG